MNRKSKNITMVVIVVSILMLTFLAQGIYTLQKIETMNNDWKVSAQQVSGITDSLSQIRGNIGYTGFIHNFKNYVIRRDDVYKDRHC